MIIKEIDETHYSVQSESDSNKWYNVFVSETDHLCTCPFFHKQGHRLECKHIRAVRERISAKPKISFEPEADYQTCTKCGGIIYGIASEEIIEEIGLCKC